MKTLACFIVIVVLAQSATAEHPVVVWTSQFGTVDDDQAFAIGNDSLGNINVVGDTYGNLGGGYSGSGDGFLRKLGPNSVVKWTRQFGTVELDAAYGVTSDILGNAYVTGFTQGALVSPRQGNNDAVIIKYDLEGNLKWTRQFGTPGDDFGFGIATDSNGSVYVSGATKGNLGGSNKGFFDAYLRKYDENGSVLWTVQLGTTTEDRAQAVATDSFGSVYIVGQTLGSLDGVATSSTNAFVAKYDPNGSLQWTRQMGSNLGDVGRSIALDELGGLYITGYTVTGSGLPVRDQYDAFLRKYDLDGQLLWSRQFGTTVLDIGESVTTDSLGNAYVVGETLGNLHGTTAGGQDAFIAKYSGAGQQLWIHQFGTGGSDEGRGIAIDDFGFLYAGGRTTGNLSGLNAGRSDAFLIKFAIIPEPSTFVQTLIFFTLVVIPLRRRIDVGCLCLR